jgi:hypothetical protein
MGSVVQVPIMVFITKDAEKSLFLFALITIAPFDFHDNPAISRPSNN